MLLLELILAPMLSCETAQADSVLADVSLDAHTL